MAVPVVSEQQFETEVLESELPVLVDFYADWCQPCKVVAPEVDAAATELENKAKFVKVDIDKAPRLAQALRIQGVPSFAVFFQGRPVALKSGVLKRKQLIQMVEPFLPRAEGAVKPQELSELIKQGRVVPVDTREANSFGRAHIPGAQSFPSEGIKERLAELQLLGGAPILYCRTGKDSKELSESLLEMGVQTGFLEGGFLAWESEFLPVERPD